MYLYKHEKGQGQQKGQTDTCLSRCTCGENKTSCERHDAELINQIQKTISKWDTLTDLGILLGVKISVIETIQEDNNSSINNAGTQIAPNMVSRDGGPSQRKQRLGKTNDIYGRVGLRRQVKDIMERHFY